MRRLVVTLVLVGGAALTALTGCGGGGGGGSSPASPGTRPGAVDPLTGRSAVPSGPVIGVKIDDTANGRPQIGLGAADVVYVEQAEGGLSRLLALYASSRPPSAGPVRSVRDSDFELLAEYGKVAVAFSGGASAVVNRFHETPLVDGSPSAHPAAYHRDKSRPAPYNLVLDVHTLAGQVGGAAGVRDVGFRWGGTTPGSATAARRMSVLVGSSRIAFTWDAPAGRWTRTQDGSPVTGADRRPISTPNVLVQFCDVVTDPRDVDQAGNPAAFTHTVGSGRAVLFRDGREVDGRWSRRAPGDRTRFTDRDGHDLFLEPGGAWVLLAQSNSPLQVG